MTKHVAALPILLMVTAPGVWSQSSDTLTKHEREFAMSHLNATRKRFQDSITGLSEAQWKFKPAPDRWSIAECAEHIAVSEDSLFQLLTEKAMKSPPAPEKKAALKDNDEAILKGVADRTKKAQAPEFLRPSGRWSTAAEILSHFNRSRDRTVAYVENTQEDLRGHVMPSGGPQKEIDAYQLIFVISGHAGRHTAQIEEVKSDPNYPNK